MKKSIFTIVLALGAGFIGSQIDGLWTTVEEKNPTTIPSIPPSVLPVSYGGASGLPDFRASAERSVNAVVHIKTEFTQELYNNPFSYFFGAPAQTIPSSSSGSGVIVTNDGFILTNHHVIKGADKIQVVLNDGQELSAQIVGKDPLTDLALLKIDGADFPYIPFGDSDELTVGDWVLAVGNPFNLTSTVTAGIVSAKARNINLLRADPYSQTFPIESFIQTDAAVNPGNSGGALVSSNGYLVGINTAIASKTGSYSGYSFAIPVNIAKKVFNDLYEFGKVQRAFIGVQIRDVDENLAKEEELKSLKGVFVAGITEGGAAEDAGLQQGDVIFKVQGIAVGNVTQLQEQIGKYRPGDIVKLTLERSGKEVEKSLTLTNRNGTTELDILSEDKTELVALGAKLQLIPAEKLQKMGLRNGVLIASVENGPLKAAGIEGGFIITRIDRLVIETPEQVQKILQNRKGGILIEGYLSNGRKGYYAVGL
ncbi:MAG: serine protease Do [Luteibaculaceae bacterium]|jgi:serine protease Do